jgi:membrane peptidoglycan carboxypeptidase
MAYALAMSVNTIAVQITESIGRDKVIDMARRLGITSELNPHASLPLGVNEVSPLEMALAYAHIANEGYSVMAYGIKEIHTPEGELLYRRLRSPRGRVLSDQVAKTMRYMLYLVMQEGTGRGAQISQHPAAGKTGTSQDYRDAWFVGFTDELVTSVWLGNDNAAPTKKVTGGGLPARTWQYFMHQSLNVEKPDILNMAPPERRAYDLLPWHQPSGEQAPGSQEGGSLWDVIFSKETTDDAAPEAGQKEGGSLWDVLPSGTWESFDDLVKDTKKIVEEGEVEYEYPTSR